MNLCDVIADFISDSFSEEGECEIGRNELAAHFNCTPSQITYVITTRFSPNQGYTVQSRRGGGGYIRITRICCEKNQKLMHIMNSVGDELDAGTCAMFIKNMAQNGYMSEKEAKMISAAVSYSTMKRIPAEHRAEARAEIFKKMLESLL